MDAATRNAVLSKIFSRGTGVAYDELVDLATQGEDLKWKEALLAKLGSPRRVLDLACGTGILTFLIRDRLGADVVGVDATAEYLEVARERARARGDDHAVFLHGMAEEAAPEGDFDAVVSCYIPKYADLPVLVPRLASFLRPGGLLALQDFLYPTHPAVRGVWETRFADLVTWAKENRPEAVGMFEETPRVIRASRWVEELTSLLDTHGFEDVSVTQLSWGTCAIVTARRRT